MDINNNNNKTILTHGQPDEIKPALQLARMGQMGHPLRDKTQENDALPPPHQQDGREVQPEPQTRHPRILRLRQDPEEEVDKYVAVYRNTSHSVTEKIGANSCLTGTKFSQTPI